MDTTNVSLSQFKKFAADIAPAARAVCMAKAFARLERERVDAYIRPIFDSYEFEYSGELAGRCGKSGRIENPKHLYLYEDGIMLASYYEDCDRAHKTHGSKLPHGHCPALHAESLLVAVENLLIELAEPIFGIGIHMICGSEREQYLDLLLGAALKAAKEAA